MPAVLPLSKVTVRPFHSQRQRAHLRKQQKARYFVINAINTARGGLACLMPTRFHSGFPDPSIRIAWRRQLPNTADSPHYVGTDAGTEPRGLVPHHQRSDLRRGDRGASGRGRPVRQAARAIRAKGKFGSSRTPADFAGVVFERTHLHWCQGSWDVDCGRCGERAWRGGVRPARGADRGGSIG